MYIGLTHNNLKNRIFVLVIVAGCLVRLVTNYLYGLNYQSPDAEWWADVYYRGNSGLKCLF